MKFVIPTKGTSSFSSLPTEAVLWDMPTQSVAKFILKSISLAAPFMCIAAVLWKVLTHVALANNREEEDEADVHAGSHSPDWREKVRLYASSQYKTECSHRNIHCKRRNARSNCWKLILKYVIPEKISRKTSSVCIGPPKWGSCWLTLSRGGEGREFTEISKRGGKKAFKILSDAVAIDTSAIIASSTYVHSLFRGKLLYRRPYLLPCTSAVSSEENELCKDALMRWRQRKPSRNDSKKKKTVQHSSVTLLSRTKSSACTCINNIRSNQPE